MVNFGERDGPINPAVRFTIDPQNAFATETAVFVQQAPAVQLAASSPRTRIFVHSRIRAAAAMNEEPSGMAREYS